MNPELEEICSLFRFSGPPLGFDPCGSGHIHETLLVECGGSGARYILQRINHEVFKDPEGMMDNIVRVTRHLSAKRAEAGAAYLRRQVLEVVLAKDGRSCLEDARGRWWRSYLFIENSKAWDLPENEEQIFQAARAFGLFLRDLADLPAPALHETIPFFHDGQNRLEAFRKAKAADAAGRLLTVDAETAFVEEQAWIFETIGDLRKKGDLPDRVTHNDTKINNVLLDEKSGEGLAVIDLDTVMPGTVLYDFGDLVRTASSASDEDELDLSRVGVLSSRFSAIARGYLSAAGTGLTEVEREHLWLGGAFMALIIGTRFLTDFLAGDVYYRIHRPGHNLDRARAQFALVRSILSRREELRGIVAQALER